MDGASGVPAGGLRGLYEMKKWWEEDRPAAADNAGRIDTVALIRTRSAEQRAARQQAHDVAAAFETETDGLDQQLRAAREAIAELTDRIPTAVSADLEPAWLPPGEAVRFPLPFRTPGQKPRLLCLHGYSQNATMLFDKTKKLRRALEAEAQLVFVDAPFAAAKKNQAAARFGDMPSAASRCFWETSDNHIRGGWSYRGCEQSILYLQQVLRDEAPIDGIIGFSQGAVLAHLLLARKLVPPTVRCVICISGFVARDADITAGAVPVDGGLTVPSIHVIGQRDSMVEASRSEALARCFDNPIVLRHAGGHFAPQQWPCDEIAAWLRRLDLGNTRPHTLDSPASGSLVNMLARQTSRPMENVALKIQSGLQASNQLELELCGLSRPAIALTDTPQWSALRAYSAMRTSDTSSTKAQQLLVSEIIAGALSQHASDPNSCEFDSLLADLFVLGWSLRAHPVSEEQVDTGYDVLPRVFFLWMLELCVLAGAPALQLVPLMPKICDGGWRDLTRLGVLAEQYAALDGRGSAYLSVRSSVVETFVAQLKADYAIAVSELSGDPSTMGDGRRAISAAAQHAPRKRKRKTHPTGLAKSISALMSEHPQPKSVAAASGGTPRTAVPSTGYDYSNYRNILSTIKQAIMHRDPLYRKMIAGNERKARRVQEAREAAAAAVASSSVTTGNALEPLSDNVLRPKPEPVVACDASELDPLITWMESDDALESTTEFDKGTFMQVDGYDGRLDLCKQVVGPSNVEQLLASLASSTASASQIGTLMIGNNIVGTPGARAIAAAILGKTTSIKTWYIAGNEFGPDDIAEICAALSYDDFVRAVWLKRNPLLPSGGDSISTMLRTNSTLETLDLVNTGILDRGAVAIFAGLAESRHTLRHLYLDGNGITADGMNQICRHMTVGAASGLATLSMGANRLCDRGAGLLCKALAEPGAAPILERLCLASNRISGSGVTQCVPSLSQLPSLLKLDFGYLKMTAAIGEMPNAIGTDGMAALAGWLKTNPPLRILDISRNYLTAETLLESFGDVFQQHNTNLTVFRPITRGGTPVNVAILDPLRKALEQNEEAMSEDDKKAAQRADLPEHIVDILSVYRTA